MTRLPSRHTHISVPWVLSFIVLGLLWGDPASAQEEDFEEWRREQEDKYQRYLNEQDEAFLTFLEKEWQEVDVEARTGSPIQDKPGPGRIPTVGEWNEGEKAVPSADTNTEPNVEGDDTRRDRAPSAEETPPLETTGPTSNAETESKEEPNRTDRMTDSRRQEGEGTGGRAGSEASLRFFGVETSVPYHSSHVPALKQAPDTESIRTFWRSMAEGEYSETLSAVQEQRDALGLSDWGYYVYLRDLGNRLYEEKTTDANGATLWTWFMMMKSGYAVRVGYRDNDVFLMLPVDQQIYNRPQMNLDGQRYYLMVDDFGEGALRTYQGQHEAADRSLELDERSLPDLDGKTVQRSTSFTYDGERIEIDYQYDADHLEYLRAYPNVELSVLFAAGASPTAKASLQEAFRPHLEERSPREVLNLLLRFVQFSTEYQTDRENFGEERFLFAEETLAQEASDCEDRAVLFAYLARMLLDRELVGLKWSNHVATAVQIGDRLDARNEDRTFKVEGETYIMADPTYIGSSLGMEMPIVEDEEPDVIEFARH